MDGYGNNGKRRGSVLKKVMVINAVTMVVVCSVMQVADALSENNLWIGILAEIILVACSTSIVYLFMRNVFRPILALKDRIRKMAVESDYSSAMPVVNTNDEVEELFDALVLMQKEQKAHIEDLYRVLYGIAENDLTVRPKASYEGDYRRQKEALDHITSKLNHSIRQIGDGAATIAAATSNLADGMQELSNSAAEQSRVVDQLTGTLTSFRTTLKKNAADADQAAEAAQSAGRTLLQGNEGMKDMLASMEELSEDSKKIAMVIKTVDDIAFQTNILALNAAVEAARAGEAGKGFAVVADEVRNLANKSAEASKGTADLIQNALRSVEKGTTITKNTANVLMEVMEAAKGATVLMGEISEATNGEVKGIEEVAQLMDQLSNAATTNAAVAEEGTASSEEVNSQAGILDSMVRLYKLS